MKNKKFQIVLKRSHKIVLAALVSLVLVGLGTYYYINHSFAHSDTPCGNASQGPQRAICIANSFVGTKEHPAYSNHGDTVDFFNKDVDCYKKATPGNAWCASFISYVLKMGYGSSNASTCSTTSMVNKFKANHSVYTFKKGKVKAGDVVYRTRPTGGHVALVVKVASDDSFTTIEGNTSCKSGDNDCVRKRSYNADGSPKDSDNNSGKWLKILRW